MTVGSIGMERELFEGMQQGESGTVGSFDRLLERFAAGEFALLGIGRLHLSNPDFAARLRDGRPMIPYSSEHATRLS